MGQGHGKFLVKGPRNLQAALLLIRKFLLRQMTYSFTTKRQNIGMQLRLVFKWQQTFSIKALSKNAGKGKIASVKLLGSTAVLTWKQNDDALVIEPLKNYPSENAVAYKITFVE